ncbi:MAG: hypothetical protein LBT21_03435 [Oscillospiraceae bacterium]|jgi:hypothetical protein|nr:hypothetical protein [Oscillospiraceae bacterium]
MTNDKPNSTARAVRVYFRAAFVIALLTAVGVGMLLAEEGTRRVDGAGSQNMAVLSSRDKQVELFFPQSETALHFELPGHTLLSDFLPPPIGNAVWFVRALSEVLDNE